MHLTPADDLRELITDYRTKHNTSDAFSDIFNAVTTHASDTKALKFALKSCTFNTEDNFKAMGYSDSKARDAAEITGLAVRTSRMRARAYNTYSSLYSTEGSLSSEASSDSATSAEPSYGLGSSSSS